MKQYFESYANEINSKFRRLNNLISHGGSIGDYHEYVLRTFLSKFISKRFGVKTGFIYNLENKTVSKQVDILIVDENVASPYFFIEDDLVVVDKKNVRCAIEVKTMLNQDHFNRSLDNRLSIIKTGCNCLSTVFAYSASDNLTDVAGGWLHQRPATDHSQENYPQSIYVLSKGIFQLIGEKLSRPWGYYFMEPIPAGQTAESMVTAHFLAFIINYLDAMIGNPKSSVSIYSPEDVFVSDICWRYGEPPTKGVLLTKYAEPMTIPIKPKEAT